MEQKEEEQHIAKEEYFDAVDTEPSSSFVKNLAEYEEGDDKEEATGVLEEQKEEEDAAPSVQSYDVGSTLTSNT